MRRRQLCGAERDAKACLSCSRLFWRCLRHRLQNRCMLSPCARYSNHIAFQSSRLVRRRDVNTNAKKLFFTRGNTARLQFNGGSRATVKWCLAHRATASMRGR